MANKPAKLSERWRSKYCDEFCEQAYNYLCEGKSIFYLCEKFYCSYPTIINWRKKHVDFGEAVSQGLAVAQRVYNDKQDDNLDNRNYNHDGHKWVEYRRFGAKTETSIQIKGLKKAIGFNEKFACLEDELERGDMTAKEAALVSKVLIDGTVIDKHDSLSKRMDDIEKALEED